MSDNIFYGGYQYNCNYLNKCIKPYRKINNNQIDSSLVRSQEAREKQDLYVKVNNLENRTQKLEKRLEILLGDMIPDIINCKRYLNPSNQKLLQKSKQAMEYMNLCARVSVLNKRVEQMAEILNNVDEVNAIGTSYKLYSGANKKTLCINMNIVKNRLDYLQEIIEYYEQHPEDIQII